MEKFEIFTLNRLPSHQFKGLMAGTNLFYLIIIPYRHTTHKIS